MNCKNCGNALFEKDTFCTKCGTPVDRTSAPAQPVFDQQAQQPTYNQPMMEQPVQQPINNNYQQPNMQQPNMQQPIYQQPAYNQPNNGGKKKPLMLILTIIAVMVVIAIVILVVVLTTSKKLVCTADDAAITLAYNKKGITGYINPVGISIELDKVQETAKQMGIDTYLDEFNTWFVTNTTNGSCKKDGKIMPNNASTTPSTPTTPTTTPTTQTSGNKVSYKSRTYTLPSGWFGQETEGVLALANDDETVVMVLNLEGPYNQAAFDQIKQQMSALADVLRGEGKTVKNSGAIKIASGIEFVTYEIEINGFEGIYVVCADPADSTFIYEGSILFDAASPDYSALNDLAAIIKTGKSSSSSFSAITKDFEISNFGKVKANLK